MTDHPTPAEIACMAGGTLEREAIQRLVVHLLNGCARCARLLSTAIAAQPAARAAAGDSAAAQDLYPPVYPAEAYDPPIERACSTALHHFRQLARDGRTTFALGSEAPQPQPPAAGLAMPMPVTLPIAAAPPRSGGAAPAPAKRRGPGGARAVVRRKGRPRRAGGGLVAAGLRRDAVALLKVEMLLATAWDLRHSDPRRMLHIGELALSAAERLDETRHGEAVVADLRARAAADLGNAHRVCDDYWKAEDLMACAVRWQRRGTGDPGLVVRIGDLLASLLVDQRRFAAADELLEQVELYHRRANDQQMTARTLIKRGIFAGYDGEPRRALVHLAEGLELLDQRQDRRLVVQAVHAILWNLVECGRYRQARIYLWRSRSMLLTHGSVLFPNLVRWLEGRIYSGMGDLERAERELLATKEGFEATESTFNAALAALDLAGVWLRQGRTAEVRRLVEEMIATFRAWRNAREAVAALLILREACDRDEATLERLQTVALLLSEVEHRPHRHPASGAARDSGNAGSHGGD